MYQAGYVSIFVWLLAHDVSGRTNRRTIAMMSARLSVCPSFWDRRAL